MGKLIVDFKTQKEINNNDFYTLLNGVQFNGKTK